MEGVESDAGESAQPPPAQGVRLAWASIPAQVRAAVEEELGSTVVSAASQPGGFSPGVAARLRLADGRRVFAKAVSPIPNRGTPQIHRREVRIAVALPPTALAPRLLWSYDEGDEGWVVLVFEDVEGRQPAQPWQPDELERVLNALDALGAALTPTPVPLATAGTANEAFASRICRWGKLRDEQPSLVARLDGWSARHLDALVELEAAAPSAVTGDTLLHFDVRADNILLTPEQVWFVDWPHARVGAAWVDSVFFAPSVRMQGGPPPEQIIKRHSTYGRVDPAAITAAVVAVAGFFTYGALQPPPPGLPTLRAFQAAQGAAAREWVAQRTGWT